MSPVRTLQTTPLATTVRPYAPGDSMNRIHWKSTARHGEIQVKEFDLEQTADAWIVLDLQRGIQTGEGDDSTVEAAVRAAASIADKALQENRSVGTDRQRRSHGIPAARPWQPPAPQDHAAPGVGRGRRDRSVGRDAHRHRRPAASRDDRGDHHPVARSLVGPPAGSAADARCRVRRAQPGRGGLPARGGPAACRRVRVRGRGRGRPAGGVRDRRGGGEA